MKKLIIIGVLLSLFLVGCSNTDSIQENEAPVITFPDTIIVEDDTNETVSETNEDDGHEKDDESKEDDDEKSADEIATEIVDYFTLKYKPEGNYVIFDNENVEDDEKIDFILRYQASDAEVDKILSEGSFPEPNVYVITVTYYKNENKFVDEFGEVLEL